MPIIKSKGWKQAHFGQLMDYLEKEKPKKGEKMEQPEIPKNVLSFSYLHNILSIDSNEKTAVLESFLNNDSFRKHRTGGNALYHEIISFHPKDNEFILNHPEILEDITRTYLEMRAPNALAYARPHFDRNHLHLHIIISGNELQSEKSIRLSKSEFEAIKEAIQEYQLENYPQLEHSYALSSKEKKAELDAKIKVPGLLHDTIKQILETSNSIVEFKQSLEAAGIQPYQYKSDYQGITYNNLKYPFTDFFKPGSKELDKLSLLATENKEIEIEKDPPLTNKSNEPNQELSESILSPYFQPVVENDNIEIQIEGTENEPTILPKKKDAPKLKHEKEEKEEIEQKTETLELEIELPDIFQESSGEDEDELLSPYFQPEEP